MRLHAYVLAGDPAWVPESVGSYYDLVDRIVVSFDASGRSWSGAPLSVDAALQRLRAADPDGKMTLLPGTHADPSRFVLDVETEQRQAALDAASEGADWVLQLDTDEIVSAPVALVDQIQRAEDAAARAVEFPARGIYARTRSGKFLEHCGTFWTHQAAFPGPVAVRAGTRLTHARQAGQTPLWRVDIAPWNTDPAHAWDARVHAIVRPEQAILHMSWVRTEVQMEEKSRTSGYAGARDWGRELDRWRLRQRRPMTAALAALLSTEPSRRFRVVGLDELARTEI